MTTAEKVMEGMKIILRHEPETDIAAEHDIIYCGGAHDYSEVDAKRLDELGWGYDDEFRSWYHYV